MVAADPWHGSRELFQVEREAIAIAGVYGTEPLLYRTAASGAAAPNPDIVRRLQTATVAHLACHGLLRGDDASLCLGGEVPLWHVLGVEGNLLPGRPLVVLSACELGGFAGEDVLAEQHGFPAGLLAIGARAVVGAQPCPRPSGRRATRTGRKGFSPGDRSSTSARRRHDLLPSAGCRAATAP